jgi:FkbM family methyltransferase
VKKQIHKIKWVLLRTISTLLEESRIVSRSSGPQGTYDGEEFIFYKQHFNDRLTPIKVLDIGANTGLWATTFLNSLRNKEILIHAIEPIPEFIELINAQKNSRILAHNFAIGEDFGVTEIAKIGQGGTSFPNTDNAYPEYQKVINWHRIPTISGDSLVLKLDFQPDLIKIDTDGFDFIILKSLDKTLNRMRPVVQFEFTYRFARKAKYSLYDVFEFLHRQNYRIEVLTSEGKLRHVAFPRLEVLNHQTKNFIALPNELIDRLPTPHT